ncbi:hypothetical protein AMECASPLE_016054, partial [Ameca splendens]
MSMVFSGYMRGSMSHKTRKTELTEQLMEQPSCGNPNCQVIPCVFSVGHPLERGTQPIVTILGNVRTDNDVVENSSPECRLNIPQLVALEDCRVLVNTFDWQAHLSPYFRKLPQIKSYQHF